MSTMTVSAGFAGRTAPAASGGPAGAGAARPPRLTRRGRLLLTLALVAARAPALLVPGPAGGVPALGGHRPGRRPPRAGHRRARGRPCGPIAERVAPGTDPRETVARIIDLNDLQTRAPSRPAPLLLSRPDRLRLGRRSRSVAAVGGRAGRTSPARGRSATPSCRPRPPSRRRPARTDARRPRAPATTCSVPSAAVRVSCTDASPSRGSRSPGASAADQPVGRAGAPRRTAAAPPGVPTPSPPAGRRPRSSSWAARRAGPPTSRGSGAPAGRGGRAGPVAAGHRADRRRRRAAPSAGTAVTAAVGVARVSGSRCRCRGRRGQRRHGCPAAPGPGCPRRRAVGADGPSVALGGPSRCRRPAVGRQAVGEPVGAAWPRPRPCGAAAARRTPSARRPRPPGSTGAGARRGRSGQSGHPAGTMVTVTRAGVVGQVEVGHPEGQRSGLPRRVGQRVGVRRRRRSARRSRRRPVRQRAVDGDVTRGSGRRPASSSGCCARSGRPSSTSTRRPRCCRRRRCRCRSP